LVLYCYKPELQQQMALVSKSAECRCCCWGPVS
jgi:hypothetical protein